MDLDVILSNLQKKVFRLKERATYTTQQTELVLMWLQSLNYHIQCLEYLELNSFLFHEEFFFFFKCTLNVCCSLNALLKITMIHCDIHEIDMLEFNTVQISIWVLIRQPNGAWEGYNIDNQIDFTTILFD